MPAAKRVTPRGQAAPPVEPNVGPAIVKQPPVKKKPVTKVSNKPGIKYVRNLRGIQCRVTLEDGKGRRIQLEPRGQRGDIEVVNKDDQNDPIYLANLDLLYEEISAEVAQETISKQQFNSRTAEHPVWDHLVNEKGERYTQRAATIEQSIAERAITVGRVEEGPSSMAHQSKEINVTSAGPHFTQVPGSPGHPATEFSQSVPGYVNPEEYHEFLLWKQFQETKKQNEASE